MEKQAVLQKEAHEVLGKLQLLEILSKYGKPEIVGSVALGLMTWPDIDIEVVTDLKEEYMWEVAKHLFNFFNVIDVGIADHTKGKVPHLPKGLYISARYKEEKSENKWKIDIWLKDPKQEREQLSVDWIKSRLTDENRKIIFEIKSELASHPQYRKTIFSVDIYDAVLEEGVKNLEEFKNYLKESNREL